MRSRYQRVEHLADRGVVDRQVETRLRLGGCRLVDLQRRHHGLAEHVALAAVRLAVGRGIDFLTGTIEGFATP